MSTPTFPSPRNCVQCGAFTTPTVRDPGRYFAGAIKPTCEAPTVEIDGSAEIVFVDGEPLAMETLPTD